MTDRFSLLFLCTGNRFRSPLAAAFVRRLTLGRPVVARSAGTLDLNGSPALPDALTLAAWSGVSLADHVSAQVTSDDVGAVDLLLGFEHAHVTHAVIEVGFPREQAFTLPELNALLPAIEPVDPSLPLPDRARERVRRAAAVRAARGAEPVAEVLDPYGRSRRVAERTVADVRRLSIELAERLFDVAGDDALPAGGRR